MNAPNQNPWLEALQRGQVTPEQRLELDAYLAGHPEERARLEEELQLNQLLAQVPGAAVSSNFTARVLEAVRTDEVLLSRTRASWWSANPWSRRLFKVAPVAAAVCLALFSYERHQVTVARRELAQNLARLGQMSDLPALDLLQNFDAIQRLNQVPPDADRELIAALK